MEDSRYPAMCLSALSLSHTGGCQKKGTEIKHRNDACVSSSCQICCRDSKTCSVTPHTRYLDPGLCPPLQGYKPSPSMCTRGNVAHFCLHVSFKAVVIVVIIYYYSGSEKIVSTDGIGALHGACWDSWTRHVTLRILGLTNRVFKNV